MMLMVGLSIATTMPGFAPLRPLVGHCWRGTLPNGGEDTHCFTWQGRPAGVRDHHVVRVQNKAVYWGETRYRRTGARIRYVYRNADGPVLAGEVTFAPGELHFGGGPRLLVWPWRGPRAYVAPTGPAAKPVLFRRLGRASGRSQRQRVSEPE